MREALVAATAGMLLVIAGLAARRSTSAALQEVGQVLVYGGAVALVIGCALAVREYTERRR